MLMIWTFHQAVLGTTPTCLCAKSRGYLFRCPKNATGRHHPLPPPPVLRPKSRAPELHVNANTQVQLTMHGKRQRRCRKQHVLELACLDPSRSSCSDESARTHLFCTGSADFYLEPNRFLCLTSCVGGPLKTCRVSLGWFEKNISYGLYLFSFPPPRNLILIRCASSRGRSIAMLCSNAPPARGRIVNGLTAQACTI